MEILYEKLLSELNVGIFIIDNELEVHYWNRWLEINTEIEKKDAVGSKISTLFNLTSKDVDILNRHIKSVLLLKTPSFYTASVNHYLFPVLYKSFTKTNFTYMQQDLTLFPYDIEKKQVGVFVYDQTTLMDYQTKLQQEIEKRQEQEQIMIEQARFVSMSQMIQNISHHWRQPLNALSVLLQELTMAEEENILDKDMILKTVDKSIFLINEMSSTIDSFRNFFQPNEPKGKFFISDALENAISLIQNNLEQNNIKITLDVQKIELENYFNSCCQVLFNLINSEIDFLSANEKNQNRHIIIDTQKTEHRVIIRLFSNGISIDHDEIKKLFDDPFINKSQLYTGINLYITKVIIEKTLGGTIGVSIKQRATHGKGLEFQIEI